MNNNQTMIPGNIYQTWLKDASSLVSKRRKGNIASLQGKPSSLQEQQPRKSPPREFPPQVGYWILIF
ncbi:hypothetical protein HU200_042880 [Digitaria exilis]|uniref:Uncharacterized protein n=1 Tax=Digitaria exilis TaxID=1010633 RepID=A0A835ECA6_9POAL|nr:hypothetical protein HU200_042880 [Digitaria exilis]